MPPALPAEAGRELIALPPRRRFSRILFAALIPVVALDGLVLWRGSWAYGLVATTVFIIACVIYDRSGARRPRITSICENGPVVVANRATICIDWRELASVTYFEGFRGSQYDVNAKGVGYRLSQGEVGEKLLEDIIDLILLRARFTWITETLAARPEILERYRPTRVEPKV